MKKNKLIKLFGLACLGLMAVDAALDIADRLRGDDAEDGCEGCLGCCFEEDPANDRGVVRDAKPQCTGCCSNSDEVDLPVDPEDEE